MEATILDMRRNPKKILDAIERNEVVTLTKRGKAVARIEPIGGGKRPSAAEHEAFGMWADRDDMEVLFELFSHRYERGSILLSSNLPFSQWERIFTDPMTTAAAVDRIIHHSVIFELNLPSYRMQHAQQQNAREKELSAEN